MIPLKMLEESQGEGFASGVPEIQRMCILGRNIVVWKDSEGVWRAVEDRCAHRLAALSLGSIQPDGTLACRYHGWCFNGHGECTHIPQAPDARSEVTACSSSRSKIQAFPTREAQGLLWVWPDDSSTAWEDSAAKDPALGAPSEPKMTWFNAFDFPVSYTSLTENVCDPIHTVFLHNGQEFAKGKIFSPEIAYPMSSFKQVGRVSAEGGFQLRYPPYKKFDDWKETNFMFKPPCTAISEVTYDDGRVNTFPTICVPTKPGQVRLIIGAGFGRAPEKQQQQGYSGLGGITRKLGAAIKALAALPMILAFKLLPSYLFVGLMHTNNTISHQDIVTLHSEDLALARVNGSSKTKVYLPTPSDSGVTAWRSWVTQFGKGEPIWFGGGSDAEAVQKLEYSDLFDNWEKHAKWCPSCRKSLKLLGRVETFLSKTAVALLICAAVLVGIRTVDVHLAIVAAIAAGLAVLGRFQVQQLRQKFLTAVPTSGAPQVSLQWPSLQKLSAKD